MLPFYMLDRIESYKIKYLCKSYIEGLHDRVGTFFHLYIKDFLLEETEVGIVIGLIPKPGVAFVSKYIDPTYLNNPPFNSNIKVVLRLDPGLTENPSVVNAGSLLKLICPINYKHNIETEMEQTTISLRSVLGSESLVTTSYGGVEGVRLDPDKMKQYLI